MHTTYADGNHFTEEDRLYELADDYLYYAYEECGIDELFEVDDAEY